MVPEHLRFGGGSADSVISPIVAIMLAIAIVLIMVLPRRKVIMPFLIVFFTIPIGEVLVVGGVHFTALRILILTVLARRLTFSRSEKYPGGINGIDWCVILWAIVSNTAFVLEFPGTPALVQGTGGLLDTLGGYLAIRSLVPDGEGVRFALKTLAVVCTILGLGMIYEQIGHVNVFGYLGGMLTGTDVTIRTGRVRSGATMGCLYAGAFSGVLLPPFIWLWKEPKCRTIAAIGLFGATSMVITSSSSTSELALMGSLVGLGLWPLRKQMRAIRWGIVASLVGLDMVMKAPVWALIARVDLTGSSASYQRYQLVDMTIRHFSDWWFIGTPDYVNWGYDSWDLCNQFAAVALTGGLLSLILYIGIFVRSFGAIGNGRKRVEGDKRQEWLLWCFGATLFATVVAHFGINYMAQLIMGFFPLVVCISVLSSEANLATEPVAEIPEEKRFEWAPLGAGEASVLYEEEPVVQRSSVNESNERFSHWSQA
jgi:hypothetical protein